MRDVFLDEAARAALDAAAKSFSRVYDAHAGLEWRLCRRPEDGVLSAGYYVYKQLGIKVLRIPTIVALYLYDANRVTIKRLAFQIAEG
jgi:hypothetical protein